MQSMDVGYVYTQLNTVYWWQYGNLQWICEPAFYSVNILKPTFCA